MENNIKDTQGNDIVKLCIWKFVEGDMGLIEMVLMQKGTMPDMKICYYCKGYNTSCKDYSKE